MTTTHTDERTQRRPPAEAEGEAIVTRGLTKRYGSTVALDDMDLEVNRGEVFGFLGPNGAGKTTAIRLLLGLARPTAGSATVLGLDAQRDAVELHRRLAYVSSDLALWPQLTGGQTLDYLGALHGGVDEDYRAELTELLQLDTAKRVRAYSRGNRQKVGLIAAFMRRPDLLIFDEPTTGLDPLMEQHFRSCVAEARRRGQTVFLSSHILSEVEATCERVGILRAGRLIEVASIDEMQQLATVSVEATFRDGVPDLGTVEGVESLQVTNGTVTCQVRGAIAPLVDALAGHDLVTFTSREPSLEELFLAHYGEESG